MRNYRWLTGLIAPLILIWLHWRTWRGKEDAPRLRERFGHASVARPDGALLWLHAASVGEANSVLLLIQTIRTRWPHLALLLTTGTVTSARLMQSRLPAGVIHQYIPVDTPRAVARFIRHWRPNIALWVESEFWPNLIMAANEYESFMGVINARMSDRSFRSWQKRPAMIKTMLQCFNIIFAQTGDDAGRLEALGAQNVLCVGNLKYDAALLTCDEGELIRLQNIIGTRPLWLAASTHPGEEIMVAKAHNLLAENHPGLLTVIVPRHPKRGAAIAAELRKNGLKIAVRSLQEPLFSDTQIYIADTLGELGLFYRLCEIVFVGGALVGRGGQNPLEPARLSCAIMTGPHTHNFLDMYREMEQAGVCLRVADAKNLAEQISRLLTDAAARDTMQNAVRQWIENKGGAIARMLELLEPVFDLTRKKS